MISKHLAVMTVSVLAMTACFAPQSMATDYFQGLSEKRPLIVDKDTRQIRLLATIHREAFHDGWFVQLPGHHAVTWREGAKGDEALFATFAGDRQVQQALLKLGAKPGNNVPQAAWDERNNPDHPAPDTRVQGTPVDAFVWWQGLDEPVPLIEALNDPSGRGIDLRFGGHADLIPVWGSGCIICLQSCPGARISNRAYTFRDYVQGNATFTANKDLVPDEPKRAVVIITVRNSVTRKE